MAHGFIPIRTTPKGRQVSPQTLAELQSLLGHAPLARDLLIEYLHTLQDHHHLLYPRHLAALAHLLKISQVEVYEVASFYHHFTLAKNDDERAPSLTVRVCNSPSCCMKGAEALHQQLQTQLGPEVRIEAVPCIGRCEQAPAATVGQFEMGHATAQRIEQAVAQGHHDAQSLEVPSLADSLAQGAYSVYLQCTSGTINPDQIIQTLKNAKLRGLGGAGFPAGRKWEIVRAQPGPKRMAVNIDEGEPGTFKDRSCLEENPHTFLEGMLIAAWAVQAETITLYLRDEYHACRQMLNAALKELTQHFKELPHIELRRGAGAYICGEESAMLESIEGRRGEPRLRPPYVAEKGLFGQATLVHNLETLHRIPGILKHPDHAPALRAYSVSGRVQKPGVYHARPGITLRELLEQHCGGMEEGHTLYGYLPGGASGGMLPASLADLPLDFDTLAPHGCFIGSAAIVVFSQADKATDLARNLMAFFVHESCGQCTPCRVGTAKALALISQPQWNIELLTELMSVMRDASICGLGQAAPNPIDSVIRHFPHEIGGGA